jgi:hypothetical protein
MSGIATACLSCLSAVDRWCHITACLGPIGIRSRDGIYETTLADNEREAVSDLLGYLENVRPEYLTISLQNLPVISSKPFVVFDMLMRPRLIHSADLNLQRHTARGDRLLPWRASTGIEYLSLLRKCRLAAKRKSDLC